MTIKKNKLRNFFLAVAILVIATGFSTMDNTSLNSASTNSTSTVKAENSENQNDNDPVNNSEFDNSYFSDNFDWSVSVSGLRSREYIVKRNNGSVEPSDPNPLPNPLYSAPTWFDGGGSLSSCYASGGAGTGITIDNWLILPALNINAGDSICFNAKGFYGIDSIYVLYSVAGDTIVPVPDESSPNWVVLGGFQAPIPLRWEHKAFAAPVSGTNARFAIRYFIHNGGLIAPHSDKIWIDDLTITRGGSAHFLNLKSFIEGFYNSSLNQMISDTVSVYVHNMFSPYSIVDSSKSVLNSEGNGIFSFLNVSENTQYYLSVKHRNSIETWSSSGNSFSSNPLVYNFTSSASQAFGNNLILKETKYCIYSGDVNQDGTIDAGDLSLVENDASLSLSGYVPSDLNGDDFVDASDLSIVENNAALGVNAVTP